MLGKIFRTITGILLLPAAVGTAQAFASSVSGMDLYGGMLHIMERGIIVYLLIHLLVFRPVYIYVLGHELVHVIATWLCGGQVVSFNVTPSGGNVATSKTNFFIELSPYFVPIYTLLLGPIFFVLKAVGVAGADAAPYLMFFVGVTLAFHFIMTTEVLRLKQPDIAKSGFIFSLVIIFMGNLFLTTAVFSPFFNGISFVEFAKNMFFNSADIYKITYSGISGFVMDHKFW